MVHERVIDKQVEKKGCALKDVHLSRGCKRRQDGQYGGRTQDLGVISTTL